MIAIDTGTNDLSPVLNLLYDIKNNLQNSTLSTFTQSGKAITAGQFFKMDDWLTSHDTRIPIYGIVSFGSNTIGFWHTIDNSINLITTSSVINHFGFTDYETNGYVAKYGISNLEGKVIDSLTNIGVNPWTNDYEQYILKYNTTYSGMAGGWKYSSFLQSCPNLKTLIHSFTTAYNVHNLNFNLENVGNLELFKFDDVNIESDYTNTNTGSYVFDFSNNSFNTVDFRLMRGNGLKLSNMVADDVDLKISMTLGTTIESRDLLKITCDNLDFNDCFMPRYDFRFDSVKANTINFNNCTFLYQDILDTNNLTFKKLNLNNVSMVSNSSFGTHPVHLFKIQEKVFDNFNVDKCTMDLDFGWCNFSDADINSLSCDTCGLSLLTCNKININNFDGRYIDLHHCLMNSMTINGKIKSFNYVANSINNLNIKFDDAVELFNIVNVSKCLFNVPIVSTLMIFNQSNYTIEKPIDYAKTVSIVSSLSNNINDFVLSYDYMDLI